MGFSRSFGVAGVLAGLSTFKVDLSWNVSVDASLWIVLVFEFSPIRPTSQNKQKPYNAVTTPNGKNKWMKTVRRGDLKNITVYKIQRVCALISPPSTVL